MAEELPRVTLPAYASIEFPDPPPDRPYLILNMVTSVDGKIVIEGTERGLGSRADQYLMRTLRVHADVVMNGANTLRTSGISPLLNHPELEAVRASRGRPGPAIAGVISGSGLLPLDTEFFTSREFDAVVFLTANVPEEPRAAIAATGRKVVALPEERPLHAMLRYMRHELDARVLLVEGGAQFNGSLLDDGLVDEVFFTIGGKIVGGNGIRTAVSSDRPASHEATIPLELISAIPVPALNEVYLRYQVGRAGA